MSGPLEVGVTHFPPDTGVHRWLEPALARTERDLARVRALGVTQVRLHLAWDAFMPGDRRVDPYRLRDLGVLLEAARGLGLRLELVLFAQSFAGCIQLPAYAVDRRRPRPGVQVLEGGELRPGGPRDLYADPLMLEVQERWLGQLLAAFAGHPAIAAWDLGHDPASTVRPRRIAHLAAWCELFAGQVRAQDQAAHLTLGCDDLLRARGVRPSAVAPFLDALGLLLRPLDVTLRPPGDVAETAAFCAAVALALAAPAGGPPPPLRVVTGLPVDDAPGLPPPVAPPRVRPGETAPPPRWDTRPLTPPEGRTATARLLGRLGETGVAALVATAWSEGGPRTLAARPWAGAPSHAREGISEPGGDLRDHGEPWAALARAEPARQRPAPVAGGIDPEQWYAHLPDSLYEVWEQWRSGAAGAL